MNTSFPIPRVIAQNIKSVLYGEITRLVKDIGKTLDVDPNILLKEINKDKIEFYIFEEEDEPDIDIMKCHSYIKKDNVYYPCSSPPIYPQLFCSTHIHNHITKDKIKTHEELNILKYDNIIYYHDKKNRVYDKDLILVGRYNEESNLIVFFKHDS
jgi:hypothetical protein